MKARSRIACVSAAAVAALYGNTVLLAADLTWDAATGTAGVQEGDGNWNTSNTNWINAAGANVSFNSATPDNAFFGNATNAFIAAATPHNVTVNGPVTVGNITFGTGADGAIYNIFDDGVAGALTLAGNITKVAGGGSPNLFLFNGLTLASGQHTIAMADSPGDSPAEMVFQSQIQGSGGITIDNGAFQQYGTAVFTFDNTYSGATNINKGRLVIASSGGLGTGSAPVTIGQTAIGGGVLSIGGAGNVAASTVTLTKPIIITRSIYDAEPAGVTDGFTNYKDAFVSSNNGSNQTVTINDLTIDSLDARIAAQTSVINIPNAIKQGADVTAGVADFDGDFAGTINLGGNNSAVKGGIAIRGGVEVNITNIGNLGGSGSTFTMVGGTIHPIGGALTNLNALQLNTTTWGGGIDVDAGQSFDVNQNLSGNSIGKRGLGILNIGGANSLTGGQTFFDGGTVNFTNTGTSTYHSLHLRSPVVNIGIGTINTTANYSSFGSDSTGTNNGPDKATVNVFGTGALNLGNADFNISDNANTAGTLNISGNGYVSVAGITAVGKSVGATGTVSISGNGQLNITRTGDFGFVLGDRAGTGTLNMSGGTFTSASEVYVGEGNNSPANGYWNQTGGVSNINNWFVIGRENAAGTVTLSNTTMIHNGGNMSLGDSSSTRPDMITVTNSVINNIAGEMWIGNGGGTTSTMIVAGASTITTNDWFVVGRGGATGTLDVSGTSSVTRGGTNGGSQNYAGENAGTGTVSVHGSGAITINTGQYWLGNDGSSTGVLNVSENGSFVVSNNYFAVGRNGTSTGIINLSGGTITQTGAGSALTLGSGNNATGIITETGGLLSSAVTWIGESGNSTLTISGGKANLGTLSVALNNNAHTGLLAISGTAAVTATTLNINPANGASGTVSLAGGSLTTGAVLNNGTFVASGTGTASIGNITGTGALLLSGNSKVLVAVNGTNTGLSQINNLTITSPAKFDLNDNDVIFGSGVSKTTVEGYVRTARDGGLWDGSGITTSQALPVGATQSPKGLGVVSAAEYLSVGSTNTAFDGVAVVAGQTLVKFTYNGDADLNGVVNANDYGHIDSGYQNQNSAGFVFDWFNGDFDYNGKINANDYALIDAAYQLQSGTLRAAVDYLETGSLPTGSISASLQEVIDHNTEFGSAYANDFIFASVPEPTTLSVIGLSAAGLLKRRRSQRASELSM